MCELHVPNFEVAKQFYGDLGFDVVWERKSTDKTEGYMVMRKKTSVLCFYSGTTKVYEHSYFRKFPKDTKRGYAVEIVIPVDDVKSFYKTVQELHKDMIVIPLTERFYYPDFRMIDPFGFYLRFVERYNWVDTRNPDGSPKANRSDEIAKYKKLMTVGQPKGTLEETRS